MYTASILKLNKKGQEREERKSRHGIEGCFQNAPGFLAPSCCVWEPHFVKEIFGDPASSLLLMFFVHIHI